MEIIGWDPKAGAPTAAALTLSRSFLSLCNCDISKVQPDPYPTYCRWWEPDQGSPRRTGSISWAQLEGPFADRGGVGICHWSKQAGNFVLIKTVPQVSSGIVEPQMQWQCRIKSKELDLGTRQLQFEVLTPAYWLWLGVRWFSYTSVSSLHNVEIALLPCKSRSEIIWVSTVFDCFPGAVFFFFLPYRGNLRVKGFFWLPVHGCSPSWPKVHASEVQFKSAVCHGRELKTAGAGSNEHITSTVANTEMAECYPSAPFLHSQPGNGTNPQVWTVPLDQGNHPRACSPSLPGKSRACQVHS